MRPIKVVTPISGDPDAPNQNLARARRVGRRACCRRSIRPRPVCAHRRRRRAVRRRARANFTPAAARDLSKCQDAREAIGHRPVGRCATADQRLRHLRLRAWSPAATFGDALLFSLDHVTMAGPAVRQISFRIDGGTRPSCAATVLDTLGDLLPFAAEFWRSSMTSLFSRVLEAPVPDQANDLPVSAAAALAQLRTDVQLSDRLRRRLAWNGTSSAEVLERALPEREPDHRQDLPAGLQCRHDRKPRRIRTGPQDSRRPASTVRTGFRAAGSIATELGLSLRTLPPQAGAKRGYPINPSSTACADRWRPSCSRIPIWRSIRSPSASVSPTRPAFERRSRNGRAARRPISAIRTEQLEP